MAVAILAWSLAILVLAATVVPIDMYWVSYYAVDYTFGFVRRGLAGEIVGLAPGGDYFDAALTMRWLSTGVYLISLVAIIGLLLLRGQRSERKVMLALLILVLPFAIPFSLYSARPDLFGAAALVALSIALTVVRSPRAAIRACGGYGALIALLALMHEAIALEFALGAVLAIVVLARRLRPSVQRGCVLLAVGPGLASALLVAAFGRHDVGAQLCSTVPHGTMENPLATIKSFPTLIEYVVAGQRTQTDYHDWVCRNVLPIYDYSITDAIKVVADIGAVPLLASFILGALALCGTLCAVRYFSGVPLAGFVDLVRGRLAMVRVRTGAGNTGVLDGIRLDPMVDHHLVQYRHRLHPVRTRQARNPRGAHEAHR